MHGQPADNGSGSIGDHTQYQSAKKRRNALKQRLAEMNTAIERGHRHDRCCSGITDESKYQKPAKKKLDGDEIDAIAEFIQ